MFDDPLATWVYENPVQITGGPGAVFQLCQLVNASARVLLVTTPGFTRRGITPRLAQSLSPRTVVVYDEVIPNPDLEEIDRVTALFQPQDLTAIVAVGGGSAIDTGKLLGVTLPCQATPSLARSLRTAVPIRFNQRLPVIAVPTTSGSGAEVTPFATVWDQSTGKKHSVAGREIYPTHAVLDPELTLSLPPDETLYSALDAISHSLESLWNKNRTFLTTSLSIQALELASRALPAILARPLDLENRSAMQRASFLAGLAISQTRTAIAHSISYPLTAHFGVPHGLASSFTLHELLMTDRNLWAVDAVHAPLWNAIAELLRRLSLAERVLSYVKLSDVLGLTDEMISSTRVENYEGSLSKGLTGLLSASLTAAVK